MDITFYGGKIVKVEKRMSTNSAGPYAVITYEKNGVNFETYFFCEDLSAFNEVKPSDKPRLQAV